MIHGWIRNYSFALFLAFPATLGFGAEALASAPVIQPLPPTQSASVGQQLVFQVLVSAPSRSGLQVLASSNGGALFPLKTSFQAGETSLPDGTAFFTVLGDVNLDGNLSASDSLILNQHLVGLRQDLARGAGLVPLQTLVGDVNGSGGALTNSDSLLINQVVGQVRSLYQPATIPY